MIIHILIGPELDTGVVVVSRQLDLSDQRPQLKLHIQKGSAVRQIEHSQRPRLFGEGVTLTVFPCDGQLMPAVYKSGPLPQRVMMVGSLASDVRPNIDLISV